MINAQISSGSGLFVGELLPELMVVYYKLALRNKIW